MNSLLQEVAAGKPRMPHVPLPLPLTAFEEYMLRDDRPKYPMSMIARLSFAGQLDRQATTEALETAVARHPLLRAQVRRTRAGRLEWIVAADPATATCWIDDPRHDRLPSMQPINLFSEPGLRAWAMADSQRSSLVLQVHHAACDGKAVFQVLDDFVRSYARVSAGKQPAVEMSPCDPQTLPGRGSFGLTVREYLRMLPVQLWACRAYECSSCNGRSPCWNESRQLSSALPASFPDVGWAAWKWRRCRNSRRPLRRPK